MSKNNSYVMKCCNSHFDFGFIYLFFLFNVFSESIFSIVIVKMMSKYYPDSESTYRKN